MDVTSIRNFSGLQSNYLFRILIPKLPFSTTTSLFFTVLMKETDIPGLTRETKNVRFMNKQASIGLGQVHDGVWKVTAVAEEGWLFFDTIVNWFKYYDVAKGLMTTDTTAYIEFLTHDMTRVKLMKINNIYPIGIPELTGLNQDNTEGFLTFSVPFGFDSIDYSGVSLTEIPGV